MSKATPTQALAAEIGALLNASPLPYADKVQALALARTAIVPPVDDSLSDWRAKRAARGVVGSGKKADAMRELVKSSGKRK